MLNSREEVKSETSSTQGTQPSVFTFTWSWCHNTIRYLDARRGVVKVCEVMCGLVSGERSGEGSVEGNTENVKSQ